MPKTNELKLQRRMTCEGGDGDEENPASRYDAIVKANPSVKEDKKEIKNSLLGKDGSDNVVENDITRAIENDQSHRELLTSTISAFGPNSTIYDESGWRVLSAEPLWEVDSSLRIPDAIIGHDDRDMIIAVECKTGLSNPQNTLQQIREGAEELLNHRKYLADKTTVEFESVERVLCVKGALSDRAKDAIDTEIEEQDDDEDYPPIYLWKLHMFEEENLQLHTHFDNRTVTESTHNNRVSEFLGSSGIDVASCPLLDGSFYPESEMYNVIEKLMFDVLHKRDVSEDLDTRQFTRGEVKAEINTPRNVPHYDIEPVAENLTSKLITDFLKYNLIKQINPDKQGYGSQTELFEIRSKVYGKRPETIRDNLQNEYKKEWIQSKAEWKARRKAVENFEDSQRGLGDYTDD